MFKINTSKEMLSQSTGGGNFISTSGVYDVTLNFVSIGTSDKSKAEQFVFNVDYNGNSQTFYGPYYQKADGSPNESGIKLYTQLGVIAGLTDGDQFNFSEESHKVGREQKEETFTVVDELSELPVKIQITAEYSKYQGETKERMNIRAFFREDGASADEIVNDGEIGKRLAEVLDKYADNVTYKDGLTAEDVAEWKASKSTKGDSGPTPKVAPKAKTSNLFGKRA